MYVTDLNGTPLSNYAVPDANNGPYGLAYDPTGTGVLWSPQFGPGQLIKIDPVTGLQIGSSFSGFAAPLGSDWRSGILAVCNAGGRYSGQEVKLFDTTNNVSLTNSGTTPPSPNPSQNFFVAVDRDGYIHSQWGMGVPTISTTQVYEYTPPSQTLTLLYSYQPGAPAGSFTAGIAVSRPNNVVVMNTYNSTTFTYNSTWFQ